MKLLLKILLFIIIVAVVVISRNAFFFHALAMIPVISAFFVKSQSIKYAFRIITALNISATLPFAMTMWNSHDIDAVASQYLQDIYVWFAIYACTSIGYFAVNFIPRLCGKFLVVKSNHSVTIMEKEKALLIEEWGNSITG